MTVYDFPVDGPATKDGMAFDPYEEWIEVTSFSSAQPMFIRGKSGPPIILGPQPWSDEEKAQWPYLYEWHVLHGGAQ